MTVKTPVSPSLKRYNKEYKHPQLVPYEVRARIGMSQVLDDQEKHDYVEIMSVLRKDRTQPQKDYLERMNIKLDMEAF